METEGTTNVATSRRLRRDGEREHSGTAASMRDESETLRWEPFRAAQCMHDGSRACKVPRRRVHKVFVGVLLDSIAYHLHESEGTQLVLVIHLQVFPAKFFPAP